MDGVEVAVERIVSKNNDGWAMSTKVLIGTMYFVQVQISALCSVLEYIFLRFAQFLYVSVFSKAGQQYQFFTL